MVRIVRLSPGFAVAPQLSADDFPQVAAEGFKSIIGNRPDGEQPGQLSAAEAETLAKANGMQFRYLPLVMPIVLEASTSDATKTFIEELPGPVLAYCRSGTRSAMAWAGMASRDQPIADVVAALRAGGYEAAGLEEALQDRNS
jgi:sulfide:quinone oxidoreductase